MFATQTQSSPTASLDRQLRRLWLLVLLAKKPRHGYELQENLRERGVPLSAGMVYRLLHGMKRQRLVRARESSSRGGPRRRIYRLTPAGEREVERAVVEARRFRRVLNAALREYGDV